MATTAMTAADGDVDVDNYDDDDDDNLPPRIGKRNDGCNETKTEEAVAIHTTIKQITGRGGW